MLDALFVWPEQTIVWWEQTIVWWQQTIVWREQTKIIRHKTIHLLAFVPYYLPAAFCEECCQSLRKS